MAAKSCAAAPADAASAALRAHRVEVLLRQLDAQRRFLTLLTHEFRTPLASIQGFAESLRAKRGDDPRLRAKFSRIIEEEARRLSRLVEEVLLLAEAGGAARSLKVEDLLLNPFLRKFLDKLEPLLQAKRISSKMIVQPYLRALAAPDGLHEILENLCSNSIKYGRRHGRLEIAAGQVQGKVLITVSDDGIGIKPRDLPHVFTPFRRPKDPRAFRRGSSGLGLSIVKDLVSAQGGLIWAESGGTRGSTFSFTLPAPPTRLISRPREPGGGIKAY